MLKSLQGALTKLHQGALPVVMFLVFSAGIALKFKNVCPAFSSFNRCPSLPSVAIVCFHVTSGGHICVPKQ